MRRVTLGGSGLEVPAQGLGCMGMSEFYGAADRDECLATLDSALELGVDLYDTADMYGTGANERLLGEWLSRVGRDGVVLATKFGNVRDPERPGWRARRGDPAYVREACEASLRRLGTDRIDLYYLHTPDPAVPIEVTVAAMGELVAAGKVRHLGLSNVGAEQVRVAHRVHSITAVQSEWSLFSRQDELDLVPTCAGLGIGYVAHSPLFRGFLTGARCSAEELGDGDFRRGLPRFQASNASHNRELLEHLRTVAGAHDATLAQVALAWVHQRGARHGLTVVPIPGTRHPSRLAENVAAADLHLDEADLALLEPIGEQVAGGRW